MVTWILVLIVAVAGVIVLVNKVSTPTPPNTVAVAHTYANQKYGITFDYPDGYVLQEGERGTTQRGHYAIVLTREEDSQVPENGEGPTGISIDIYQNNLDKQTLSSWLNTSESNYKLGNGTIASSTVAGKEAVVYQWSGLYEGETTAFLHNDNVVAVSLTWLTPQDENIQVYRDLIKSIR